MTKSKASSALKDLIDSNTLNLKVMEWVVRKGEREGERERKE